MRSFIPKLVAALVVAGALAACGKGSGSKSAKTTTTTAAPTTTTAAPLALSQLGAAQADVPAGWQVKLYDGGDQVKDEVTLDICDAPFPSEALRVARYQVGVADAKGNETFSTEAVQYRDAASAAQAMTEVRAAISHCPADKFVKSSVDGVPPLKYAFKANPDATWPATPGVDRIAIDATVRDQQGHSQHEVATYLQRGPVLLGLYFQEPDKPLVAIAGQTTQPTVVAYFATRLATQPGA